MASTLRPRLFFGWIVSLVTTLAVIVPFSTTAGLDAKFATALVSLAIGVTVDAGTQVLPVNGASRHTKYAASSAASLLRGAVPVMLTVRRAVQAALDGLVVDSGELGLQPLQVTDGAVAVEIQSRLADPAMPGHSECSYRHRRD